MFDQIPGPIKNILLILSIATALFLVWYTDEPLPSTPGTVTEEEQPDAFMEGGVYREYDETGDLSILFTTKQGVHFPDSEEAIFGAPVVTIFQEKEAVWVVNANRGQYFEGAKKLILKGRVNVNHQRADSMITSLVTDHLTMLTDERFITTDAPVEIIDNASQFHAIGVDAWLNEKRVVLKSRVQGTYYPSKEGSPKHEPH